MSRLAWLLDRLPVLRRVRAEQHRRDQREEALRHQASRLVDRVERMAQDFGDLERGLR